MFHSVGNKTFSRAHPESRVFAAIPGRTSLGPVLEVRILKILGQLGLENSILSTCKHETTSYVVITRGAERLVDEIRDHKNEVRSRTELLSAFQKSEKRDPCVEEAESNSMKETCAHPITSRYGNKEACHKNYHSYERKKVDCYWRQSFARWSFVDSSIQNGYTDGTSSRSSRTRTRWIIPSGHREIGIAGGACLLWSTENSRKTIGFGCFMKAAVRKELSTVWIIRIPCVSESFWWTSRWRKPPMVITLFFRKYITKLIGNAIRMPSIG